MYVQELNHLFKNKIYLKLLLILFLIGKTSLAWGFSVSRVAQYQAIAKQKKLWSEPLWIKLGHYEKSILGHYTSAFTSGLFLDEKGFESPEKEIESTIQALYSESEVLSARLKRHPQCHYLARSKWLNQVLGVAAEDILPCEDRKIWKKNLNASQVAIIFAASDFGNASSSFGHTFLKLINIENQNHKDLIDYGVDYSAETGSSDGLLYAVKGIFGFYPGRFAMLPYHQKIRDYINLDGRDIWEYHLSFTSDEVEFLIDHLLEMENARAPYLFFNDNCSYQILKTLEVVRPNINLADTFNYFVIPIDTIKKVKSDTNWVSSVRFKKSLKSNYLESYSQLGSYQKKALDTAVEKLKISDDFELSKSEKAQVYETATKYYAVRSYRTGESSEDQQYALSTERAMLGMTHVSHPTFEQRPPEDSHGSSAIYLQRGYLKNDLAEQHYTSFKFRNALHDLEQIDFGTVPFSQNQMAVIELKYDHEKKEIKFDELTFLNLINLNPVTQLDKHFSWKVKASLKDEGETDFEGSGGLSFNSQLWMVSRTALFMTGRSWYDEHQFLQAAGPEILTVFRPMQQLGISLSASYLFTKDKNEYIRFKSKLNYNLNKEFDIQGGFENSYMKATDTYLSLVYNFLL
jgi:hypothetical protein